MFVSLGLYNNNKFIDGKKLEFAHLWGKAWQRVHNNHRLPFKKMVSKYSARMLTLLYVFNGGRWGSELQYRIGRSIRNLKDPDKQNEVHQILKDLLIPTESDVLPKIEVKNWYAKSHINRHRWRTWFEDEHQQQLIELIAVAYEMDNLTMTAICESSAWKIKRIKGFYFHAGNNSFYMNFDREINGKENQCLVKTSHDFIMKFNFACTIQYNDYEPLHLCKGAYYPIETSQSHKTWHTDMYSTMDYININDESLGWCFLSNIHEAVLLIHNCISFGQVKNQLPKFIEEINKYDFMQNIISWSNQLHRYKHANGATIDLPCGPQYICKTHQSPSCQSCCPSYNVFPQNLWNLKWTCNTEKSPHFWIFDSKNGLVMSLMKVTRKSTDM